MKRLLLVVLFLLLAFYIAWPGLSAWQIYGAVKGDNPARLAQKIDFPSVRDSMQPVIEAQITKKVEELKAQQGDSAALLGSLLQGGIVSQASKIVVAGIVTPENMIRLANQPGSLPEKINRIISESLGGLALGGRAGSSGQGSAFGGVMKKLGQSGGGIGSIIKTIKPGSGQASQPAADKSATDKESGGLPKMGLANIKSFGLAGLAAFDIGLARDPSASGADLTARMEFKDFDWKLTRVVPHLK